MAGTAVENRVNIPKQVITKEDARQKFYNNKISADPSLEKNGQPVSQDPEAQDKPRKGARALRWYGNFNGFTAVGWGTLAVVTGGAGAVVGGTMAAIDTAQFVGSHAAANAIDKKQRQEGSPAEGENGTDASATSGEAAKFPDNPQIRTRQEPRLTFQMPGQNKVLFEPRRR